MIRATVPFEEDPKDSSIWFLDHKILGNMALTASHTHSSKSEKRERETANLAHQSSRTIHRNYGDKTLPISLGTSMDYPSLQKEVT